MRTAESIEQNKAQRDEPDNRNATGKKKRTLPEAARPFMFKPGVSGNPGGKPKTDVAKMIAQAAFDADPEALIGAFYAAMRKGNAYVFKELADRAYGKMTDKMDLNVNSDIVERLNSARKRKPKE